MVERVFCVDFGSAYTKVALRRDPQARGELVACADAGTELWAPTVVAADWSKGEARLDFGYKAAGIKPGGPIKVYADFKKDLFSTAVDASGPPPLDALLQSEEFEALAAKYGVLPTQVAGLRMTAGAARALVGGTGDRAGSSEARRQDEAKRVAYHYFKWLRERVMDACGTLPATGLKYEDIPLRVTVPVLGEGGDPAQHPGCLRLREALGSTGWKLDDRLFVSEPESNAVGILTHASNALTKKQKINLGEMFSKGPLITVLKGDRHHPTYRALVIDVGAFTTDFAALSVDTGGEPFDTSAGAGFGVVQRSVRLGVTNLDASVRAALPAEKQGLLDGLARKDFAIFQSSAYTEGTGYNLGGGRVLGGAADRDAVQTALVEFSKRLVDEVTAFRQQLQPASMEELILTGGGSNIPAVRDALIAAAQTTGKPFVKTHAPDLKRGKAGSSLVDKLDTQFTRGGSALGGASIYFEKSYY